MCSPIGIDSRHTAAYTDIHLDVHDVSAESLMFECAAGHWCHKSGYDGVNCAKARAAKRALWKKCAAGQVREQCEVLYTSDACVLLAKLFRFILHKWNQQRNAALLWHTCMPVHSCQFPFWSTVAIVPHGSQMLMMPPPAAGHQADGEQRCGHHLERYVAMMHLQHLPACLAACTSAALLLDCKQCLHITSPICNVH